MTEAVRKHRKVGEPRIVLEVDDSEEKATVELGCVHADGDCGLKSAVTVLLHHAAEKHDLASIGVTFHDGLLGKADERENQWSSDELSKRERPTVCVDQDRCGSLIPYDSRVLILRCDAQNEYQPDLNPETRGAALRSSHISASRDEKAPQDGP